MIRINLAPERERRRGPSLRLPAFNLGVFFGLVYLLAVLGVSAYWWTLTAEESDLQARIDQGSKELAQLKAVIGQVNKVRDRAAELRKRVAVIEEIAKNQAAPILLVDTFVNTIPPDLWITSLQERGSTLRIAGAAFSATAVSDFMANLRSSGKFKDVDIVVSRRDLARPTAPVTFEITCRFEG